MSDMVLELWVPGIPRPGGSKKGFYSPKLARVLMVKAGGQLEENWRQAVSYAAMKAMNGQPPLQGPVCASYEFIMPRPKYHYYTSKARMGQLKPEYADPCPHTSAPDRGKLLRSTEDSMTGIVYADDSQVWDGPLRKRYGDRPGALIRVLRTNQAPSTPAPDRRQPELPLEGTEKAQ